RTVRSCSTGWQSTRSSASSPCQPAHSPTPRRARVTRRRRCALQSSASPTPWRTPVSETTLNVLLDFVKRNRGFDFSGYKRSSLERRIGKRMEQVGAADYAAYLDLLEADASEFDHLFNTILINVTSFFRDAPTWEYVGKTVIPQLMETRGAN